MVTCVTCSWQAAPAGSSRRRNDPLRGIRRGARCARLSSFRIRCTRLPARGTRDPGRLCGLPLRSPPGLPLRGACWGPTTTRIRRSGTGTGAGHDMDRRFIHVPSRSCTNGRHSELLAAGLVTRCHLRVGPSAPGSLRIPKTPHFRTFRTRVAGPPNGDVDARP